MFLLSLNIYYIENKLKMLNLIFFFLWFWPGMRNAPSKINLDKEKQKLINTKTSDK